MLCGVQHVLSFMLLFCFFMAEEPTAQFSCNIVKFSVFGWFYTE